MMRSGLGLLAILTITITATACAVPRPEGVHSATPADAALAGALTANELSHQSEATTETVYGWHLEVVGDHAKYFACSAADVCSFRAVEVKTSSLIGTQIVSRTSPVRDDGTSADEADVVRLTLARDKTTTRGGVSSDSRGLVVH